MQPELLTNVSVGCVVFGFDLTDLNVILTERTFTKDGISYNDLNLPGEVIRSNEDPLDASR